MSATYQNTDSSTISQSCPECGGRIRTDEKTNDRYCEECGLVVGELFDRDVTSASPFRSRATRDPLPREKDESRANGRRDEGDESPKTGEQSGRPLGGQLAKDDLHSKRWERLRKRDEGVLLYDRERDGTELSVGAEDDPDFSAYRHRGAGVATDNDEQVRLMSLLGITDGLADELEAPEQTQEQARTLVMELDTSATNGRSYESLATAALVVAHDEHVAERIQGITAQNGEIRAVQQALERAHGPSTRFRVLNNLGSVATDERLSRLCERRLTERDALLDIETRYGFDTATVVENVRWSA